ncbi:MAG: restriction endonuclease subunit S [Bacteroidaceae bacterium]|nr:restriction endonuclease subunit S [Bacteroidaceae bacterium]
MNKKGKLPFAPKLRFQKFHSTGEWKLKTLHSLATKITAKNNDTSLNRVLTNSAVDGVIDQRDFFDREITNKNKLDNYFIIDEGDYVYNPRISVNAPVGPISKNKVGKGIISPLYTVFRFKNQKNDFFEQYFKTNLWHKYLKSISNTGARYDRMSISIDDFMSLPLPYPSEPEQQKIADCLTSLDDLINAEDKKLETLKMHKKGLMYKLFPAEGKTVPEWRFPEFIDSDEWEETTLAKFSEFRRGSFPQPYGLPEWYDEKNGMPFIQVFDVGEDLRLKSKTKNKISKLASYQSVFIPTGTVIVTIQGSIGRVAITQYDAYIDRTLLLFEKFNKETEKTFFAYVLQILFGIEKEKAPGCIIKTITKDVLSNFVIKIPHNIKEQKKIADCLSSLDDLITAQTEKLESLKTHKKGLMQGLFPSIAEVDK